VALHRIQPARIQPARQIMEYFLRLALVLSCSTLVSSTQDVPLGMCGNCEVNCFEDCALKYDREIIQPDLAPPFSLSQVGAVNGHQGKPNKKDLAKNAIATELNRLKAKGGKKCSKAEGCKTAKTCASNMYSEIKSLAEIKADNEAQYEKFEEKQLQDGHDISNSGRTWADVSGMKVTISDIPEFHAPSPSMLSRSVSLSAQNATKRSMRGNLAPAPGGANDPNEPRNYFPLHPVKMGSFEKGLINLDQCLNFCLATTCGCEGVPGMEDKSNMGEMEEMGKEAGTHHSTPPVWKYRKAKKEECAHGLGGNKIIKDLYVDFAPGVDGWIEVCTKKFFDIQAGASAMLGLNDPQKELDKCDCGVNRLDCQEPTYGCSWNQIKSRCEYKAMHNTVCYKRYTFDGL